MKSPRPPIGRMALRVEGDLWNAYYALPGTMEGAIFLGSVRIGAVRDARRKNAFMALMTEIVGDFLEPELGQRPRPTPLRSTPAASVGITRGTTSGARALPKRCSTPS